MLNPDKPLSLTGVITARTCPTCGHHEIGMVTEDGVFHPLTPGTRVSVTNEMTSNISFQTAISPEPSTGISNKEKWAEDGQCWVPEPLLASKSLRLTYGVFLPKGTPANSVSADVYQAAYLKKLYYLVEDEQFPTLAVVLDQFFSAPYLASDDPQNAVMNMWKELQEIRQPVELMKQWFQRPDEEALQQMIGGTMLENAAISEETFKEELTGLDLETFLELL